MSIDTPLIVALDYSSEGDALNMAKQLDPDLCRVKVGKELFVSSGPSIVDNLHQLGFDVFLDLKFHDIPNTCAKAVAAAADLGVWMMNVHASGGRRMMEAARNELDKKQHGSLLVGVTVLTSIEQADLTDIGLHIEPQEQVARLALLAESSGLDGVVCSAQEVGIISNSCASTFLTVTPGIRPESCNQDDQRRVMTPEQAFGAGVNYMVIGRPITQSEDPQETCRVINELTRNNTKGSMNGD